MSSHPVHKTAPPINLPPSNSICNVSVIDTTCDIVSSPPTLVEPPIAGHDWLNLPTYSFLIEHKSSGTKLLFDMGSRTDWQTLVPHVSDLIAERVPGLRVDKEVPDILKANGVNLASIEALILSHWHYDHIGNFSRLHAGTDLLVGPGFSDAFMPGYPTNKTAGIHEAELQNVQVKEVPFQGSDRTLKLGDFEAFDYFGDGSIYILNVPGHTVGHISALVRTTPETAVFLGGDVCHFPGVIRPTEYNPMPDTIPSSTMLDKRLPTPCPCSIFTACHPDQANAHTKPFYRSSTGPNSWYEDPVAAAASIDALKIFDADPNVLVLIAHDTAVRDVVPLFPTATVNDWQAQGWKDSMRWQFVNELPVDGRVGRPPLVDGTYLNGVQVKDLYGNDVKKGS